MTSLPSSEPYCTTHGGWFDKFTGDGFICYWLVEGSFAGKHGYRARFLLLRDGQLPHLLLPGVCRQHAQTSPPEYGLSIRRGRRPVLSDTDRRRPDHHWLADRGFSTDVRDLPALPSDPHAYPGSRLVEGMAAACGRLSEDLAYQVEAKSIVTKEYPHGQVAYAVEFYRKGPATVFLRPRPRAIRVIRIRNARRQPQRMARAKYLAASSRRGRWARKMSFPQACTTFMSIFH